MYKFPRFMPAGKGKTGRAVARWPVRTGARSAGVLASIFGGVVGQVLFDHQRHLEHDGVVEFPQVQPGELFDLLQPVDQGIAVHEQAAAGLGHVQVVFKEALDGEQGLLVQALDAALLEHLFEEHLADGGGP